MRTPTRDKIIQVAQSHFYQQGFHAVGVDQIVAEAGVTKSTFYNHFESKDDLIHDVLTWHDAWWRDHLREMLKRHGGDTPKGQLLAIPDALGETISQPGYNGCIFVNVAVQFPLPHDPVHAAAADHKARMEDIYRELAGYAGAERPEVLAKELALLTEGAYVTTQVSGMRETMDIVRTLVNEAVARHVG